MNPNLEPTQPTPARTDTPELLPCPFCGGKAQHTHDRLPGNADPEAIWPSAPEDIHHVRCNDQDCRGWASHSRDTEEKAIATWNRRDTRSRDELRRALEKAILIIEKAKPYVAEHAAMSCDDAKGLGADFGDAYWLDVAEQAIPKLRALLP